MIKKDLLKRLEDLKKEKAMALAKANFVSGQVVEVENWLQQLEESESSEEQQKAESAN